MAIAKYTPEAPTPVKVNAPVITEQKFSGVVVDTKYTPLSSLLTYTEGSSWTVDYYSQVIDKDNDIRSQDIDQSAIYQQYTEIKGMEIKVSNPLTSYQEQTTSRMTVNGTATVYPFVIPNVGDMFVADVGDGREGVFKITTSERKSLLKESVYVIEYTLLFYADTDKVRRQDLINKAIVSYYYVKDFLLHGQNPLLIKEDYYAYDELTSLFGEITQNYFNWFYSNEYKTLILPGQSAPIYDHFLVTALLNILDTRDADQVKFIRRLNVDDDEYLKQPQLWEALVNKDKSIYELANRTMGLVSTKAFNIDPMLEGIRYTGIKYIVYPDRPETSLNSGTVAVSKTIAEERIVKVTSRSIDLSRLVPDKNLNILGEFVVNIKPVLIDNNYVLSDSFYSDIKDKSLLEILTMDYINNKAINPAMLLKLVKPYKMWGGLERYYYLPIVIILIKAVIRNV